ncbi:hypothetical protein ACRS85_17205 [Pluralibacter gergoviae]|uniref:hypothetical protein n=1 Tax=Pluralibacter gergoviae TaxID=61647 RepID=UPI003EE1D465
MARILYVFYPDPAGGFPAVYDWGDILLRHQHRRTRGDDHPWQRMPHQEMTPHIAGSPHRRAMLPGTPESLPHFLTDRPIREPPIADAVRLN